MIINLFIVVIEKVMDKYIDINGYILKCNWYF